MSDIPDNPPRPGPSDDNDDDGDDDDDIDDIDDDVSSKGYGADWTEVATWSLPGIWADNT